MSTKNLSTLFVTLALLGLMILSSCNKDDDCTAPVLSENIVGSWDTPELADSEAGTVTFNADGTGTTTEGSIFAAELNDVPSTEFTYTVSGSDIEITNTFPGSGSLSYTVSTTKNECNEIDFDFFGFASFSINRK